MYSVGEPLEDGCHTGRILLQLVWPTAIQAKILWRLEIIMSLHDAGHMNKDKINIRWYTEFQKYTG
jgi:hypothetical protein